MSLLRDIQEGTTDQSVSLSGLLRKSRILAKRLQHEPLGIWADRELNGYPDATNLPPYRQHRAEAKGHFVGPFYAELKNVSIPPLAIDEEYRETLFTVRYMNGVAHYEAMLKSDSQDFAQPWSADFVAVHGDGWIEGYNCANVRLIITRGALEGMLDQIRNRILSFVLEIEEENPEAGEAELEGEPPVSRDKVDQIYNTVIIGGPNVVASGSHNIITDFNQVAGDWSSLKEALERLGIPEAEIDALESAMEEDREESPPGPAVKSWLKDIRARVESGSLTLANSAAGSVIATVVLKHLGVL